MATILESIGDYLQAENFGVLGTDIFLSMLPDSPDECLAIYEDQGGEPRFSLGPDGIQIDQPNIQIISRAGRDDYPTARDKAESIRRLLSAVVETEMSGLRVMRIQPVGSVLPLGVDPENRSVVSINFRAMVAHE
jgi:hypothetical protein